MKTINLASDFSKTPLGRFPEDGDFNGSRFREEFLLPGLRTEDKLVVDIDGLEGYGSSFHEEAFGGLVKKGYFTATELRQKLEIRYKDPESEVQSRIIWKCIDYEDENYGK